MFETLYLSMDANFKLKQKERGLQDPPLANGYAYMVLNEMLLKHLDGCKDNKLLKDQVCVGCQTLFRFLTPQPGCHLRF